MKVTLTEDMFVDEFIEVRPAQFTHEGLRCLFAMFAAAEEDIGSEIEFDPVAICCEFTEYESFAALQTEHDVENFDQLSRHTWAQKFDGGRIMIQNY